MGKRPGGAESVPGECADLMADRAAFTKMGFNSPGGAFFTVLYFRKTKTRQPL